jgi:hypothetical protein
MTKDEFVIHACEQVLRFSKVTSWDELSEERRVQLGFNMGAMALGLELSKEEGFLAISKVRQGTMTMQEFRDHMKSIIVSHGVEVNEENIAKPFEALKLDEKKQ